MARDAGDSVGAWLTLYWLAETTRCRGDCERALAQLEECLALTYELGGEWGIGIAAGNLARGAAACGEYARAAAVCRERLTAQLGRMNRWDAGHAGGAGLGGERRGPRSGLGRHSRPAGRGQLRGRLGRGASLEPRRGDRRGVGTGQAAGRPPPTPPSGRTGRQYAPLTEREAEVVALVVRGLTNQQIAAALAISERTAGRHLENILRKLDFRSRAKIARWAVDRGLPWRG